MAVLIHPNGNRVFVQPKNGKYFSLEEKQQLVGGRIEVCQSIDPDGRYCLIIDEEGKCKNKEINPIASMLYKYHIWEGKLNDVIVGTAIYGPYSEMFEEDYLEEHGKD